MKIILRTCAGREEFRDYLIENIPNLVVVQDTTNNAMETFLSALQRAGTKPAVHIEDDIELAPSFSQKLNIAISKRPDTVIQFFSMRKADLEVGSRLDTGSKFMMCQCFYLPQNYSKMLYEYHSRWPKRKQQPRSGYDLLVGDFLKSRRERYWIHIPNLVNHRIAKSIINPRRSMFRRSKTFSGGKSGI